MRSKAALCLSLLALVFTTGCGGDALPAASEVSYAKPVPALDSLPEASFPDLDTVLKSRLAAGDTLPLPMEELAAALPATLIGFGEPEVNDAQEVDEQGTRLNMAKALFFDENDNYMEVQLMDLGAEPELVRSVVDQYRGADGTVIHGVHLTRLPVMPKGRIGYIRREAEGWTATVLSGFRYQLVMETDASCEADCFLQVASEVKWEKLK